LDVIKAVFSLKHPPGGESSRIPDQIGDQIITAKKMSPEKLIPPDVFGKSKRRYLTLINSMEKRFITGEDHHKRIRNSRTHITYEDITAF
jgi:hypothetical protein